MTVSFEYLNWCEKNDYKPLTNSSYNEAMNFYINCEVFDMTPKQISNAKYYFKRKHGISIDNILKDDWGIEIYKDDI